MSKFNIINILDLVDSVGDDEVIDSISKFKCNKNSEIEEYLKNADIIIKALDVKDEKNRSFERKNRKYNK